MDDVSPFVSHFAQLVWLLVHKPADHDAQKEELRRALMQASAHPQAVVLRDITLAASTRAGDGVVSQRELAMRMAAHSVRLLEFDSAAPARDVFEVAKALASVPVPGDEGASFDEKLVSLFLTGVTTHLGTTFVRHATPGVLPQIAGPMRTPVSAPQVKAAPLSFSPRPVRAEPPPPVLHPANDVQAMMQVQLMPVAGRDETVKDLIHRLDGAVESPNARALVDDITRATEDLANQGKWTDVVQVLDRAHHHYAKLHDSDVKRAFLMGIRRLQRPEILNGVTRLIPGNRELRDTCTRLLSLAGESGADVLIDNLIGSDVSAEAVSGGGEVAPAPAERRSLVRRAQCGAAPGRARAGGGGQATGGVDGASRVARAAGRGHRAREARHLEGAAGVAPGAQRFLARREAAGGARHRVGEEPARGAVDHRGT
jgi:hypothetical protein